MQPADQSDDPSVPTGPTRVASSLNVAPDSTSVLHATSDAPCSCDKEFDYAIRKLVTLSDRLRHNLQYDDGHLR